MESNEKKGGWTIATLIGLSGLTTGVISNRADIEKLVHDNLPGAVTGVSLLILLCMVLGPVVAPVLSYLLTPRSFDRPAKQETNQENKS